MIRKALLRFDFSFIDHCITFAKDSHGSQINSKGIDDLSKKKGFLRQMISATAEA
ncbi:MAG: hypothetical protein L7V86_14745 [Verrucomicrobiales bacterium]|nr:hypothetical protein [Verrucomicrobiales bacterium]MDB4772577.1 hypothetical protein [Verrucomicrobiales bacterium]MDC0312428.1 hypothetical protein [Verrucomicrobiales bacterium]